MKIIKYTTKTNGKGEILKKEDCNDKACSEKSKSRSRSKDKKIEKKLKEKAFLKSEDVWKNSTFDDDKKKQKFLRLLGAKANIEENVEIKKKDDNLIGLQTKSLHNEINVNLENQFKQSIKRKNNNNKSGLGFN